MFGIIYFIWCKNQQGFSLQNKKNLKHPARITKSDVQPQEENKVWSQEYGAKVVLNERQSESPIQRTVARSAKYWEQPIGQVCWKTVQSLSYP